MTSSSVMCVIRSHQPHRSYRPRPSSTWSDSPKAVSKHQPGSRSLTANRLVTSVPSGSTPAADNAALGDPNVPTPMFLKNNPTEPTSCAFGSCNDAAVQVVNTAGSRAEFFRHVCDTLPYAASIPLPFSAQDILNLHPTVILGTLVACMPSDHQEVVRSSMAADRCNGHLGSILGQPTRLEQENKKPRQAQALWQQRRHCLRCAPDPCSP